MKLKVTTSYQPYSYLLFHRQYCGRSHHQYIRIVRNSKLSSKLTEQITRNKKK
jgi:hypothetical protein